MNQEDILYEELEKLNVSMETLLKEYKSIPQEDQLSRNEISNEYLELKKKSKEKAKELNRVQEVRRARYPTAEELEDQRREVQRIEDEREDRQMYSRRVESPRSGSDSGVLSDGEVEHEDYD